jgi:Ca-activated chloride channel family protein
METNSNDATIVSPESHGDATIVAQGTGAATVVSTAPVAAGDATVMAQALQTVDLALLKPEVTLNLMVHNPYALADARSENYLLCELSGAFMGQKLVRPPVNLSIVLDKSGSMEGKPLEYVKEACRHLIDKLGPADTLSVVTFAEAVDVVLAQSPVTMKEALKAQLDLIRPRGTTNLYGGMTAGANQLAMVKGATHLSRIILLTDGEANEGVTEYSEIIAKARSIKREGFSISTIGVGVEYNE